MGTFYSARTCLLPLLVFLSGSADADVVPVAVTFKSWKQTLKARGLKSYHEDVAHKPPTVEALTFLLAGAGLAKTEGRSEGNACI